MKHTRIVNYRQWVARGAIVLLLYAVAEVQAQGEATTASGTTPEAGRDWLQFKGNPERTGFTEEKLTLAPTLMWKHVSKPFPGNPASALAGEGSVFFCSERLVYCLDAESGALQWWHQADATIRSTPALGDGLLYVASLDGKITALRADSGDVAWIFPTSSQVYSSPLFLGGNVYVGSNDRNLYCLSAASGEPVWKFRSGGDIMSGPAISGNFLYFLCSDGSLYSLKVKDGQFFWKTQVPGIGQMLSTPAVSGDSVWVASGKNLYSLKARTGTIAFSVALGRETTTSPVMTKDTVFIGNADGVYFAVDARRGAVKWKTDLKFPVLSTGTIVGDKVLVGTTNGFVYALQTSNGTPLWKYKVHPGVKNPNHVAAAPIVSRGSLYIVGDDGALYGFKPWGIDLAEPSPANPRINLKASDLSMVYYPLESPQGFTVPRISGVPPVSFSVTLTDEGSGIDESSIMLKMNEETKTCQFHGETGLLEVELSPPVKEGVALKPIYPGTYNLVLEAKDYHGNLLSKTYKLVIDNKLHRPEPTEKKEKSTNSTGFGGESSSKRKRGQL